jgi:hypothetical protein
MIVDSFDHMASETAHDHGLGWTRPSSLGLERVNVALCKFFGARRHIH